MAVGFGTYKESDGQAVNVSLTGTVLTNQLIYADGFLGIAMEDGESGDEIAVELVNQEYQFIVPSGLAVAKGDTVYVTVANVTGNTIADNGYTTSSGAGKVAAFKATAAKDSNNMVTGIFLRGYFAS